MAFWSQADFKEPLRANKWYIEFTSILRDVRFALKECKKPSYKLTETKHRCFNHVVNLPGTLTWDPISIKFASIRGETLDKDASVLLWNVLRQGGYDIPKTFLETTLSKTKMHNALETGLLNIIQVDPEGNPIEVWSLYNAYISTTDFGSLSYENENIVDISCNITYDFAELNNEQRAIRLGIKNVEVPETETPPAQESDIAPPESQFEEPPESPAEEPPEPIVSAEGVKDPMAGQEEANAAAAGPVADSSGVVDPMAGQAETDAAAAEGPRTQPSSTPPSESATVPTPEKPVDNQPTQEEIDAAINEAKALTKETRDATKTAEENARNQKLLEDARENEDIVKRQAGKAFLDAQTSEWVVSEKITYSNGIEETVRRQATNEELKTRQKEIDEQAKKLEESADAKLKEANELLKNNRRVASNIQRNRATSLSAEASGTKLASDLITEELKKRNNGK